MALSVQQQRTGPAWALGFVNVANNGTPVCIMVNVDANNTNSPNTPSSYANPGSEYTPRCIAVTFQAYKPGANNNGMVQNANNVYILVPRQGNGNGNRSDSGSMIKVLFPGADYTLTCSDVGDTQFSPYSYFLDADTNGDGALVTLIGMKGQ